MASRYASKRAVSMPCTFSNSTARGRNASVASSVASQPLRASAAPRRSPPLENGWHGGPPASRSTAPAHGA